MQVSQAPAGQMESSKSENFYGGVGIFSLFGLLALIGLRRYKK